LFEGQGELADKLVVGNGCRRERQALGVNRCILMPMDIATGLNDA
jgi:hypothetical protein